MSHAYGVRNWSEGPAYARVIDLPLRGSAPWKPAYKLIAVKDPAAKRAKPAAPSSSRQVVNLKKKKRQNRKSHSVAQAQSMADRRVKQRNAIVSILTHEEKIVEARRRKSAEQFAWLRRDGVGRNRTRIVEEHPNGG